MHHISLIGLSATLAHNTVDSLGKFGQLQGSFLSPQVASNGLPKYIDNRVQRVLHQQ